MLAAPWFARNELSSGGADGVINQKLTCWVNPNFGDVAFAALIVHIECNETLNFIAPQFNTNGGVGGRGKDVDNCATTCNMATQFNEVFTAVANCDKV